MRGKMKRTPSQLEASGLAFAGYTLWVLTDTSLKIVGTSALPFYEILALVGAAIVLALLLRALWRKDVAALWPKRLAPQLWRACLDAGNNIGVVIAIRHLPLALFYILVFFAPIVTTLLGAVLLGEALTWKRSLAIAAGFAGVVVAVNPFGVARPRDWTGYIACAVCVACFSTNMVWTRRMMQTESQESLTFVSSAVMMVAGGLAMLWHAEPFSLKFGAVFAATGPICVLGSFLFLHGTEARARIDGGAVSLQPVAYWRADCVSHLA